MDKEHKIYLHGNLGKKYGKKAITIYGYNLQDVFKGLCCRFGHEFKETIKNGMWHVTTGKRITKKDKPIEEDNFKSSEEVEMVVNEQEIHVFPLLAGSGNGIGKIILGVVLIIVGIVVGVFFGWTGIGGMVAGGLISAGLGQIMGGAMQLMSKPPKIGNYQNAEVQQRPSFLFNGIVNTVEQGGPVPLVYGRHLTGSTVISAGMTIEQI